MNIQNIESKEWKFQMKNKQTNAKWRELGERKYHTTPISTANIDSALYKLGLLYNATSCISLQITITIDGAIRLTTKNWLDKWHNAEQNANPQSPIHSIEYVVLFRNRKEQLDFNLASFNVSLDRG